MDLGDPASYLTLRDGTPVLAAGGEQIGVVEHVLADPDADVFDGLVIDTRMGPGGWRFADASLVASIYERGVLLTVAEREAEQLPAPDANPAEMTVGPDDIGPEDLGDMLRRAWNVISGKY
jgi:hypothetical protein